MPSLALSVLPTRPARSEDCRPGDRSLAHLAVLLTCLSSALGVLPTHCELGGVASQLRCLGLLGYSVPESHDSGWQRLP